MLSCLPVRAWKEKWQYDRTEDVMKIIMISGVSVLSTMLNVSCPWEIHELSECVSSCVCAYFGTPVCFSHRSKWVLIRQLAFDRNVYETFACLIVWKLWYLKSSKTLALLHMSLKFVFFSSYVFFAKCNKKVLVLRRSSQLKAFLLRCQILPLPCWAGTVFYRHVKDITRYILPRFCFVIMYQFKLSQSLLSLLFRMFSLFQMLRKREEPNLKR